MRSSSVGLAQLGLAVLMSALLGSGTVGLALAPRPAAAATVSTRPFAAQPLAARSTTTDEAAFIGMINRLRAARGLSQLTVDPELTAEARRWSTVMAGDGRLRHAGDLATGISADWLVLGENVGVHTIGELDALFDAFVDSPAHLANLVDPRFGRVGVGVAYDGDGKLWTTHRFMATPEPAPQPAPAPPPPTTAPTTTPPTTAPPTTARPTTTTRPTTPPTTARPTTTTRPTTPPTTARPTTTTRPTTRPTSASPTQPTGRPTEPVAPLAALPTTPSSSSDTRLVTPSPASTPAADQGSIVEVTPAAVAPSTERSIGLSSLTPGPGGRTTSTPTPTRSVELLTEVLVDVARTGL